MKLRAGQQALVTGASSGIGRAFALALARRGLGVVLVARGEPRLEALAREIEALGSRAEVLVADLGDAAQVRAVEQRLASAPPIDLFVDNAAFGVSGPFVEVPVEDAEAQIRVNVIAPTRLLHAALTAMGERGHGAVVNVSSGAAFVPSLRNAAYSATKAYLAILSLTLTEELRGAGIDVVTVFPGFTRTEFQQRARFDVQGVPGFLWQDASTVVGEALSALEAGRSFCVPGAHNRVALALNHLVPYSWMGRAAGWMARLTPRPRGGARPSRPAA
jgi:short-subunit dehydrogenase